MHQRSPKPSRGRDPAVLAEEGGTNRCSGGSVVWHARLVLAVAVRPVRTSVHLVRRGRVVWVLHLVAWARLVRRVGGRVSRAVRRERGIYRSGGVRLGMIEVRHGVRTCCLSHTGGTSGLRVRGVGWRRAREVFRVGRARRRWVQSVFGLGGVGGRNIGGSHLGLRSIMRRWTNLRLRGVVMSTGSSRIGVCGEE